MTIWFFWPPRPFDGLNGLRYYFTQKKHRKWIKHIIKHIFQYITWQKMTIWFFGPWRPFDGLQRPQQPKILFYTKNNLENGSSIPKNIYFNTSHDKKWPFDFWPPRPIDGLSSLRYHFTQKITLKMDSAYRKTYISIPHMTENDLFIFWPLRPFYSLQRPQQPKILFYTKNNLENGSSIPKNIYFNTSHDRKWPFDFLASEAIWRPLAASAA